MKALQRRVRVAAVIGVVAAAGAGTMIAVVGTASATEPAKCVENVNVREEPRIDSRVVALCKAGTTVEAGEVRNGFVKLVDLGGWSSQEFISINGQRPVKPSTTSSTTEDPEGTGTSRGTADEDATPSRSGRSTGSGEEATPAPGGSTTGAAEDEPSSTAGSTDRSQSHTNGAADNKGGESAAKPAPAKPAPGGLPLPLLGG